jgi:diguanylate cyclase
MNNTQILIVEDELIIAKNTANKLQKLGYSISKIVSSGEAAIESINCDPPDLILMDISIKGDMDGIETADKIKETADIPVVFLTAYANDETLDRAAKTGSYGYIIKPFREQELHATIKITLSKHQEQSSIQKALQSTVNEYSSQYNDIYKDNLTNLPNKLFLRDLFDYFLSLLNTSLPINIENKSSVDLNHQVEHKQTNLEIVAVLHISLERFEKISNSLTKEQQDFFVQEIARRLTRCVDDFDFQGATVYLEKSKFVVIVALDKRQTATNYAQDILNQLRQVFLIDNREIFLSASIGISFYPFDSVDIEELLQQGKQATEYATSQGGNRCQLFTFALNIKTSRASEGLAMEAGLHYALERNELELYYQPKVDLRTNLIVGAEALVRWNHPKMGMILADRFIPLAEESGLIRPIGEWVLDRACRQATSWHDAGLNFLKIAVNLSGFQFRQSDLFHTLTQILFNSSIDPQYLELELTETILVENIKTNIQRLNLIKKLGIQIALDDFGTGYSSLGYLQQFPFDILKIDQCFVRNIDENKVNAVITQTIIQMAHQLGLKVVAEGVESKAELDFLRQHQCDEMQGFLFSRPLGAKEFRELVVNSDKCI